MIAQHRVAFLIVLLFAGQASSPAESKPLELKWTELAPLIQGHQVQLTLAQGTRVKGEAVVVREDALVMDVKKVSGPGIHQPGSAAIPRESVTFIKLERTRGSWGRSIGSVIGVLAGIVVGTYVAVRSTSSAGTGIPVFLGVASGLTLGGYYGGRQIDKRDTLIKIVTK